MTINYAVFEIFKRTDRVNILLCSGNFALKKEGSPDIKLKLIDLGIWTADINDEKDYSLFIDDKKIDMPVIENSQTYRVVI
jgi:hypothetical protein